MQSKTWLKRGPPIIPALVAVILLTWAVDQPPVVGAEPVGAAAPATEWVFQGRVYDGETGFEPPDVHPLAGVTVCVHGAMNPRFGL
ncbi:MAG: hypothetical protein AUK03_09330 [Anaerolineae bacterium CG2_30_64_16]|nr:MAG: hypothetical protein AUK03_09330 [Anaerolineae bacterium CG2_30_64_16]